MAKSIVLYGFLLGIVVCLCLVFNGFNIEKKNSSATIDIIDEKSGKEEQMMMQWEGWLGEDEELSKIAEAGQRARIQQIFKAEIGVRERTGKNDGKRVGEYLRITGLDEGYAWCAAFVSWVFSEAGFAEPRTPWSPALFPKKRVIWERSLEVAMGDKRKLNAKNKRVHSAISNQGMGYFDRKAPQPGDVFGIYFNTLKRIAHVGFIDEWGDKYLVTVEGNTNESGSNEGDGVYRKRRLISTIYQVADWICELE